MSQLGRRSTRWAIAVAGCAVMVTAACSSSSSSAPSSSGGSAPAGSAAGSAAAGGSGGGAATGNGGTVTIDTVGPVTSFDPVKGSSFQDALAAWTMYDALVTFDTNGKIIADLASKWTTTANSASFTLKPGVTCSDGTAVTPAVAANSVRRFLDPKTASPFLNLAIGFGNTATVTPTADGISVKLAKPFAGLLAGLALPYAGIVCPSGLANPAGMQTTSAGTGAFASASQVAGSSYTFTRRSNYTWGPTFTGTPTTGAVPSTLVMKVITDENTRANLMATNALQIGAFTSDAWSRFKSDSSIKSVNSNQTDTMLLFNETAGHATADPAVRKAIQQAVNRDALNKVQSFGAGELINNIGQPAYACYDDTLKSKIPANDPGAAGAVLKGKKIAIIGTNVFAGGDANSYLLSALQAVGADVTVRNMNNEAWVTDLFSGKNDWDVTILGYGNVLSSLYAAGGFFVGNPPPGGQNIGAVKNAAADKAFTTAGTASGAAECTAMGQFQSALLDNFDTMPLSTVPVHVLFAGGTSGAVIKGFIQPSSIRIAGK